MNTTKQNHEDQGHHEHQIVSYREHFSTLIALLLLTVMTVAISVFGSNLRTLSVATALLIASVKAIVVAYYFMHLKYDKRLYTWLLLIVGVLFVSFLILTSIEFLNR
jgi:cytochrome c oxidase subunit 4